MKIILKGYDLIKEGEIPAQFSGNIPIEFENDAQFADYIPTIELRFVYKGRGFTRSLTVEDGVFQLPFMAFRNNGKVTLSVMNTKGNQSINSKQITLEIPQSVYSGNEFDDDMTWQSFVETYIDDKIDAVNTELAKVDEKASIQADWEENDETSKAYVKNRTHKFGPVVTRYIPQVDNPSKGNMYFMLDLSSYSLAQRLERFNYNVAVGKHGETDVKFSYPLYFKVGVFSTTTDSLSFNMAEQFNLFDTANYKGTVTGGKLYVILDTTLLSEEDATKFEKTGIYFECTTNALSYIQAGFVTFSKLAEEYISSKLVTERKLYALNGRTVVDAINEVDTELDSLTTEDAETLLAEVFDND